MLHASNIATCKIATNSHAVGCSYADVHIAIGIQSAGKSSMACMISAFSCNSIPAI